MAKYQIAIQYNDNSEPVLKEFEIPDEAGTYELLFTLDDDRQFSSRVTVDGLPHTYRIRATLDDENATVINLGEFQTPATSEYFNYEVGGETVDYYCMRDYDGSYLCVATAPDTIINISGYILTRELVELIYEGVDLLQGDWVAQSGLAGHIKSVSYNRDTKSITVKRFDKQITSIKKLTTYTFSRIVLWFSYKANFILPQ